MKYLYTILLKIHQKNGKGHPPWLTSHRHDAILNRRTWITVSHLHVIFFPKILQNDDLEWFYPRTIRFIKLLDRRSITANACTRYVQKAISKYISKKMHRAP